MNENFPGNDFLNFDETLPIRKLLKTARNGMIISGEAKEKIKELLNLASEHFLDVYDDFHNILNAAGMPSCTWMNLPIPNGRMHIPSADFSFMISPVF